MPGIKNKISGVFSLILQIKKGNSFKTIALFYS